LSKGRLLAAQIKGYLDADHWLDNARHANAMAARLAEGLTHTAGLRLAWERAGNEVFAIMPRAMAEAMRARGCGFHEWTATNLAPDTPLGQQEGIYRLVTSFATRAEQIDAFIAVTREAGSART